MKWYKNHLKICTHQVPSASIGCVLITSEFLFKDGICAFLRLSGQRRPFCALLGWQLSLGLALQQICTKKVPFDKSIGSLCPWPDHSKCFLKPSFQSESFDLQFLLCFLLEEEIEKTVWVFIIFIFNFKCCQAHEEVKNWVGLYDRTSPRTSENWMWPKSLLLKQVYFHELAVLFFWAGRTGLILAPLLTRLCSQFSFVFWDSLLAKRKKTLFSCPYWILKYLFMNIVQLLPITENKDL